MSLTEAKRRAHALRRVWQALGNDREGEQSFVFIGYVRNDLLESAPEVARHMLVNDFRAKLHDRLS